MRFRFKPEFAVIFFALSCIFPSLLMAADGIETAGTVIQVIVPAVAYGMTFVYDDADGRLQFYESFAATLATTYALKLSINKERPNGGSMSFPSGHTSAAFSGASFIQKRYGWEYGVPAYLAASFVGWSRVESKEHYVEDVLAGAAIGIASTYIFTDSYKEKIAVTPFLGDKAAGLVLSGSF
ncbi:MAG: phosphatase PAP2 family protein [Pseudomonadota bacterium]